MLGFTEYAEGSIRLISAEVMGVWENRMGLELSLAFQPFTIPQCQSLTAGDADLGTKNKSDVPADM